MPLTHSRVSGEAVRRGKVSHAGDRTNRMLFNTLPAMNDMEMPISSERTDTSQTYITMSPRHAKKKKKRKPPVRGADRSREDGRDGLGTQSGRGPVGQRQAQPVEVGVGEDLEAGDGDGVQREDDIEAPAPRAGRDGKGHEDEQQLEVLAPPPVEDAGAGGGSLAAVAPGASGHGRPPRRGAVIVVGMVAIPARHVTDGE